MNSSAANLSTAVKGVASGTESTLKGSLGSEVRVILKVTLEPGAVILSLLGMSEIVKSSLDDIQCLHNRIIINQGQS